MKKVYDITIDLENSLNGSVRNKLNENLRCKIETLIKIADYKEESSENISKPDMETLCDMLSTCPDSEIRKMVESKKLQVSDSVLGYLLQALVNVKQDLVEYSDDLRVAALVC